MRVMITGMGAITPLGLSVEETWQSLLRGRSGIARFTHFDPSSCASQIGGEVKNFDPRDHMEAKEARRMARFSQFAVAATKMALADAQLIIDQGNAEGIGIILGTGIGGALVETMKAQEVVSEKGAKRVSPFYVPSMLPNMAAYQVSHACHIKGPSFTITTACAAGTQAIGEAFETIRRGAAQVMITGGIEASHCITELAGFCAMHALSTRNDEPERASRPFDKDRDGFVVSEGCGILVLESLPHALARGARIHAQILGYGASSDALHVSAPDPTGKGAARAMMAALKEATLSPEEVDYINAHATSTPLGDSAETLAIKRAFGDYAYKVPISATKSMTGHLLGAAGAIEAIASTLTIQQGMIHPTINYETPDPDCDLDYVPNVARAARVDIILSNSFAFGGVNACLVLARYEE